MYTTLIAAPLLERVAWFGPSEIPLALGLASATVLAALGLRAAFGEQIASLRAATSAVGKAAAREAA